MPRYTIVESVGNGVQAAHDYQDLERHHPTRGNERGRVYATVNGEREELLGNYNGAATVSRDGDHYVSKDFVLQAGNASAVPVPAIASGYIGRVDPSDGIVQIYDKPANDPSREMIAQYRHLDLRNTQLEAGDRIEYGQSVGIQGGFNNGNPKAFGKHVHVDINTSYLPQADRYIRDMDSGAITTDHRPQQASPNLTAAARVSDISGNGRTVAAPSGASVASAAPMADGVLRKEEHGPEVKALQERLNQLGYTDADGKALGTDGKFGDRTKHAVEAFQRDHHLDVDGIAGKDTLTALREAQVQRPGAAAAEPADAARPPLLSDKTHPQNPMYQQSVAALEKLGPSGGFKDRAELERAAGALTHDASISGMTRIDHVVASNNGNGLIAVEGKLDDPAHRRAFVDRDQATQQTLEQSTQKLRQDLPVAVEPEPVRETTRAMSV
ncbi:peptidoglycan-binding domain-containing protein [Xanthomonas sp. NCPPB 2654]|uniref:peptidoglycan-binding domain-containing protein n=1 Tax=unclassified Xanthomonas TaxID=2643310 RepID=UPI0021E04DE0|nr:MULTISPECIES: peptidoglycan-binding domain-containing protein [unclassified Xanthomonas]MDL5366068.1 peptidoglycan-binding domain-containing protein [Xanthomonas sp. NCPPB 2654]UYC20766.1 peptidoglycan-binding protein [Xanthomonas sp. CFBP 8443]